MENENKTNETRQDNTSNTEAKKQPTAHSVFTKEEIEATVRSFVLAWIKNDVKIHFAKAPEIMDYAKQDGRPIDLPSARIREHDGKLGFLNTITILAGTAPATAQQQEQAINEMFKDILSYRCGDRVEGTFGKKEDYEARLCKVEEKIEAMNNSIEQLIIWYRSILPR